MWKADYNAISDKRPTALHNAVLQGGIELIYFKLGSMVSLSYHIIHNGCTLFCLLELQRTNVTFLLLLTVELLATWKLSTIALSFVL